MKDETKKAKPDEAMPSPLDAVVMTLNDVANEICRDLPEGFTISLELEQGAGYVELTDGEGNPIALDNDDLPLLEQLRYALQRALAHDIRVS